LIFRIGYSTRVVIFFKAIKLEKFLIRRVL